jgi:hypothetical protein
MTTDPTAPRDVSGTPGHEALRAYWEVPPGGLNPKRPTATPPGGDILSNLRRSQVQRSNAIGAANRPAALAAHEDYLKGATLSAATREIPPGPGDTTRPLACCRLAVCGDR